MMTNPRDVSEKTIAGQERVAVTEETMTTNRSQSSQKSKRAMNNSRKEIKLLIAAATLASTIGGWAVIAKDEQGRIWEAPPTASASGQQASDPFLSLPPLPTLVPITVDGKSTGGSNTPTQMTVLSPAPSLLPAISQARRPAAITRSSR
ncbi:MAG: hypothetical protein Q7O66_14760 [Dehalococcoidia bacterium]|nr:hypothetical protein [Dehalococcoidia bacterium]